MDNDEVLSVSVISHGQIELVAPLLADIAAYSGSQPIECILTLNLQEELPFDTDGFSFPVRLICNSTPQGFGANHNQAFREARGKYFCVLNPDVRLSDDAFRALVRILDADSSIGLVAPQIVNPYGVVEDSARRFPSVRELLGKTLGGHSAVYRDDGNAIFFPDWVAGMFMMFPRKVFAQVGGFDERYFLYYEDVDICARLQLAGYRVALCRDVSAVHDARRTSHRNPRYALLHLSSILRFFLSPVYRQLRRGKSG